MIESKMVILDELLRLPGNPKGHAVPDIRDSMGRFGFLERIVVNRVTGHVLSGHGRAEALAGMRADGKEPPGNIEVGEGGAWLVPVDFVGVEERDEGAAAIALNRLVEKGGWDDVALAAALSRMVAEGGDESLAGTGYDRNDVDAITAAAALIAGASECPSPPSDFAILDDDMPTEYRCPKCGYEWRGKAS